MHEHSSVSSFRENSAKARPDLFTAHTDYTAADLMTVLMAREIKDGNRVFFGVSSHMPAVAAALAKASHASDAVLLNIPGGINFSPKNLRQGSSASGELLRGADGIFPLSEVFDLSMRGGLDVAFLSGIQFDVQGNVNASVIGEYSRPKLRAPGGAGSAVFIPTARKAVLWRTKHDRRVFVERVDFVTTRGNIGCVVTPLCVFGFNGKNLTLRSIHPGVTKEELQENTSFALDLNAPVTQPPTQSEMKLLRQLDPTGLRSIEF